jgi:molybdenum cofactor cytidylyltransferase
MGQPKAWLRTAREGECFLSRACALLAETGVDPVVVVVAPGAELMAGRVAPAAMVVANSAPERGQLSSLQTAIRVIAPPCEALIMLPVDVPFVSAVTVRALIEAWRRSRAPVVRPVSGTRHGHPVIFGRALFEPLMEADLSTGAKPVVRTYATAAGDIPVDDEGAFADVDTVEDYVRAFGRLPERQDLR